jgi:hypothetical protein
MLDLRMVDVAISLALLYMMLAGFVSGLQEWLSTALQLRGKHLQQGISNLLHELGSPEQSDNIASAIYTNPLIGGLSRGSKLPSYISAGTFAVVLAEELVNRHRTRQGLGVAQTPDEFFTGLSDAVASLENKKLRDSLSVVLRHAGKETKDVRQALEQHFDNSMERVSGWYKRHVQRLAFVIALICAVAFNVDTLAVIQRLNADPALAASLADRAQDGAQATAQAAAPSQPVTLNSLQAQAAQIKNTSLPLGWQHVERALDPQHWPSPSNLTRQDVLNSLLMLLGWLITAAAATLGAPFWFDVISRLVPLRSSSKPAPKEDK